MKKRRVRDFLLAGSLILGMMLTGCGTVSYTHLDVYKRQIIEKAASLRAEYVVAVVGKVEKRSGAVNDKIATGEIEVIPSELRVLSESQTPPFPIEENSKTKEDIRLKYRYLDLRRPDLQRNLRMKSQVMTLTRQFFSDCLLYTSAETCRGERRS